MASETQRDISEILASDPDVAVRAATAAVQDAILRHKQMGLPMAVWRDGAVVWIPPEELPQTNEGEQ
jgi:hypothetical protein